MADVPISSYSSESENKSFITTKIPPGGKAGQALVKASNRNNDVMWSGSVSGGSGGNCVCDRITIPDINKILKSK